MEIGLDLVGGDFSSVGLWLQEGGRRTDDGKDASSDCPRLKYFEVSY
jgi:hypothetical protein